MYKQPKPVSFLMLVAGLSAAGVASACGEPPSTYLGSVCLTAATYCPYGYMPANGAPVSNPMLPSVLGKNTLPNLTAAAPAGTIYCVNVVGVYPQRP